MLKTTWKSVNWWPRSFDTFGAFFEPRDTWLATFPSGSVNHLVHTDLLSSTSDIAAGWFVALGGALLKRCTVPHMFVISHFQGTNPVQYNVSGWLKACRENPVSRSSATVLQESKWCVLHSHCGRGSQVKVRVSTSDNTCHISVNLRR